MKNNIKLLKIVRAKIARSEKQLERWRVREAELLAEVKEEAAELQSVMELEGVTE